MNSKILVDIINALKTTVSRKSATPEIENSIPLDSKNFHKIEDAKSGKRLAFVDGGNAEIIAAPNFSLHFTRVYYCIYEDNKKVAGKKSEFYSLASTLPQDKKIFFKTKIFSDTSILDENDLVFDSEDRRLMTGFHRFPISKIGEISRRFAELKIASEIDSDYIILDGDLQSSITNEEKYIERLKHRNIFALSKAVRLFTDTGDSFTNALRDTATGSEWFYYPVVKNSPVDLSFVKLNKSSKHIFKLEFFKFLPEIIPLLKENSKDPIFQGYPYGLIDAHNFARITAKERQYLRTLFMAKAKKDWEKLSQYMADVNAHDILDQI